MGDKPRHVLIRERLDRARSKGLGFYASEDLIADLAWLLDEHKRMRRDTQEGLNENLRAENEKLKTSIEHMAASAGDESCAGYERRALEAEDLVEARDAEIEKLRAKLAQLKSNMDDATCFGHVGSDAPKDKEWCPDDDKCTQCWWYDDVAKLAKATEALEIIAGERQCIDSLMSDKDIARAALALIMTRSQVNVCVGTASADGSEHVAGKAGGPSDEDERRLEARLAPGHQPALVCDAPRVPEQEPTPNAILDSIPREMWIDASAWIDGYENKRAARRLIIEHVLKKARET